MSIYHTYLSYLVIITLETNDLYGLLEIAHYAYNEKQLSQTKKYQESLPQFRSNSKYASSLLLSSSSLSSLYNSDLMNNTQEELELYNGIPKYSMEISTEQSSIDDNHRVYYHDHDDQQPTNHHNHYRNKRSSGSSSNNNDNSYDNRDNDNRSSLSSSHVLHQKSLPSSNTLQIETLNKYEWNRICLLAFRTKNSEVPLESYREAFTEVFLSYVYVYA